VLDTPQIPSPKRTKKNRESWDGFFPYYAGFSEHFARELISNSALPAGSVVHDPWNGSGTTTYAASIQEIISIGFDLNPVMVIVAKARLLPPSETDSIEPLGQKIISQAENNFAPARSDDPLTSWFGKSNAGVLRSLEVSIQEHLVGSLTLDATPTNLDHLSNLAAANYVALFSVCREMVSQFQSTNPTWLRYPRIDEEKPRFPNSSIRTRYLRKLQEMAKVLEARGKSSNLEAAPANIRVADTTKEQLPPNSVDLVLTSPPYCTRIDYTAATRVELALLSRIATLQVDELSSQMIGSIRVPRHEIEVSQTWGQTCGQFLKKLHSHPSKASSSYYYRTHLDYFDKMSRSIANIQRCLKPGGKAILVVQDSHYKEIYNDLPKIISDICANNDLILKQRANFHVGRTMAASHPYARRYKKITTAVEAVLCFERQ
jgi:DNA modification methylase